MRFEPSVHGEGAASGAAGGAEDDEEEDAPRTMVCYKETQSVT